MLPLQRRAISVTARRRCAAGGTQHGTRSECCCAVPSGRDTNKLLHTKHTHAFCTRTHRRDEETSFNTSRAGKREGLWIDHGAPCTRFGCGGVKRGGDDDGVKCGASGLPVPPHTHAVINIRVVGERRRKSFVGGGRCVYVLVCVGGEQTIEGHDKYKRPAWRVANPLERQASGETAGVPKTRRALGRGAGQQKEAKAKKTRQSLGLFPITRQRSGWRRTGRAGKSKAHTAASGARP